MSSSSSGHLLTYHFVIFSPINPAEKVMNRIIPEAYCKYDVVTDTIFHGKLNVIHKTTNILMRITAGMGMTSKVQVVNST